MLDETVLVIGYGSHLRGDDAAGPSAARRLARRGFDARAVHQLTPELAEVIAAARVAVFVDSSATVPPGQVAMRILEPDDTGVAFEHVATPARLLWWARQLYGAAPEAVLFRLGAACFDTGAALSRPARRAIGLAVAQIEQRYRSTMAIMRSPYRSPAMASGDNA